MNRKFLSIFTILAILLPLLAFPQGASAGDLTPIYDIQYTTDPSGDSPLVGDTVTTQGIVTAFFYAGGNKYTFIQDGTGPWSGLILYRPDAYINVGDLLEVTGTVSEYYGLTQIAYGDATVISSSNPLPSPEILATVDVSQEGWESVLVRVENVTVTDLLSYGEWKVDDGSGPVVVDDLGSYGYSPANGQTLNYVQGPLYYAFGAFKIEPRDDNDIDIYIPPPPVLTIMEIQGSSQFSPYEDLVVETSGVVTLFTANGANFWLQDPVGDGDPATSDGIFVAGGGYPDEGPRPEVGDFIRVVAKVQEQQFGNALPLTRLRNVDLVEVLSNDNDLPDPVELEDLPDDSITAGIDFWEPLEGMLVSVHNAPVVSATSRFGEFAMITKDDAKPGSGFYPQEKHLLIRTLGDYVVDYNPERILVDDSSLDNAIDTMPGDRMRELVGVVDYSFGNYKLQPASYEINNHELPSLPASDRSNGNGNLVITSFNVENLFDLVLNVPTPVDVIGQIGFDPGSEWGSGDASTKDNTIRRQSIVCAGDPDGSDPFDPAIEWDGFAKNTFDGLGVYDGTCTGANELFISEYIEGSSNNKAIEIYNGTGQTVNLAAEGYALEFYFNGKTYPGTTIPLSGILASGDVFVVADDGASSDILAVTDQTSTRSFFNGDDAVVLRKGGKDDASSTPTPAELETKLAKLALAIQIELELPEILILQEIENQSIAQVLGDRVNAATGTNYQAVSFETSDGRGIEAGFLYDADRVNLVDAFQMATPAVSTWFGPSSPSPGREPIVGIFEYKGTEFTLIGNHFKSKGGDDPLFGINWPPMRWTETQRKGQAEAVREFVNAIFASDPDAYVIVAGDLNDFEFGEPGEAPTHPVGILEGVGGEVPLTNLVNLEKEAERYTYLYDGNSQVLDHMLVSPSFLKVLMGTDILHFNAGIRSSLAYDASTPLRCSDHDPVEGRFKFR